MPNPLTAGAAEAGAEAAEVAEEEEEEAEEAEEAPRRMDAAAYRVGVVGQARARHQGRRVPSPEGPR
ncbi:hypothetical protein [Kribbella sp. DT2]|uniref:hypothetical protein n=1 Tax=Kribbella sp. DT2 TaxID=3393427 RepID=UPI003CF32C69